MFIEIQGSLINLNKVTDIIKQSDSKGFCLAFYYENYDYEGSNARFFHYPEDDRDDIYEKIKAKLNDNRMLL